jgi:hypothetical protein
LFKGRGRGRQFGSTCPNPAFVVRGRGNALAARVSTGSALAAAAQDALVQAAGELLDTGTQEFWKSALRSVQTVKDALRDS